MGDWAESNVFLKSTKHKRVQLLACLMVFWDSWFGLLSPSLSESRLFVCNICFGHHSDPFQYDPIKDLACMWDKSNCSVICTLFKIIFLWSGMNVENVHSTRPLASFADRHTYSVHSVQYCLSSCFEQFCCSSSGPVALRLAVWRMAQATSGRSGGGSYAPNILVQFLSLPRHCTSLHNTLSTCLWFVQLQSNLTNVLWLN